MESKNSAWLQIAFAAFCNHFTAITSYQWLNDANDHEKRLIFK